MTTLFYLIFCLHDFFVLNATFSNISAISWRPVLVVEEAGVPGESHRPWARTGKLYIDFYTFSSLFDKIMPWWLNELGSWII
jgi:hypothetical protein